MPYSCMHAIILCIHYTCNHKAAKVSKLDFQWLYDKLLLNLHADLDEHSQLSSYSIQ